MYNNLIVSIVVSVVPILALIFVAVLLGYKLFIRIRSNFNATVNCWFCNRNTKVPYPQSNSWTCPQCEQYNGFTKDGDYNREILEQRNCSGSSNSSNEYVNHFSELLPPRPLHNGFCDTCNEAQRLKVEKLAQFEPKKESRYDSELKSYKAELEEQYRLCETCHRHLNKVLREKKKMVLGSKFLDYIIKGAETLKHPHFNHLKHLTRQKWKSRLSTLITVLALLNVYSLSTLMVPPSREQITSLLGETVGTSMFVLISHALTILRVSVSYLEDISTQQIFIKFGLFIRTVFFMILYSLGLRLPHTMRCSFVPLYLAASPFMLLATSFIYNLLDKFKVTRFTFMMVLWSAFAGGLITEEQLPIAQSLLLMLSSLLTSLLSATVRQEVSPKLQDTSQNSFHKIYSDDYFSDEDTISMLSEQFNSSSASVGSKGLNRSFCASPSFHVPLTKSPITSSTLSLNHGHGRRNHMSPNSSFRSLHIDDRPYDHLRHTTSFHNFNKTAKKGFSNAGMTSPFDYKEWPRTTLNGFSPNADSLRTCGNTSFTGSQRPLSFAGKSSAYTTANPSMHSPCSFSTNSIYQQRRSNLISPSRFEVNGGGSNRMVNNLPTSWLSGGYFNQCQPPTKLPEVNCFRVEARNNGSADDNMSRSSSQSSGFESQNERLNLSRENSCVPDIMDTSLPKMTNDCDIGFKPIESNNILYRSNQNATATNLSFSQSAASPSINLNGLSTSRSDIWKSSPSTRRSLFERDTFNLRKINEELPTIKRGDLLKNWQHNQFTS